MIGPETKIEAEITKKLKDLTRFEELMTMQRVQFVILSKENWDEIQEIYNNMSSYHQVIATEENIFPKDFKLNNNILMAML